ncbi:MAG: ROK family protein [Actinomycetota bacterium]|nr:ROK family protein [Actinomycetota bacterium]
MAADCVIGVDLGGTKVLAGAVDTDQQVHYRAHRPVLGLEQAALLETIVEAAEEVRSAAPGPVVAVGFGIPSLIDQRRGMAVMSVNLPIADMPFRDVMAERLGLPAFIDNDGNVAALAEHRYGAAKGSRHTIMLTIGTGVGGGLVLEDHIYRGSIGAGAELGHMVIDMDGPACQGNCPNRGCLEAMASGTALVREANEAARAAPDSQIGRVMAEGRELTGPLITELAHDGDTAAREVLALIGRRLGVGVANYVNIFNPDAVVIGGGVIAAGDLLLGPVREELATRGLRPSKDMVEVVPARFANEAGMLGAAALAFDGAVSHQDEAAGA